MVVVVTTGGTTMDYCFLIESPLPIFYNCDLLYIYTSEKNLQNISMSRYSPIATTIIIGSR